MAINEHSSRENANIAFCYLNSKERERDNSF